MPTKKAVTPINIKYNANTFQPIRGRTVGDGLTAADILINIIIIPILTDVRNIRGFMIIWQMAMSACNIAEEVWAHHLMALRAQASPLSYSYAREWKIADVVS
jgi:hypothetical protein